tara:strand:+ start:159 stop:578 length:420 start_codon:yes stop_codon:yes gene_type:complete
MKNIFTLIILLFAVSSHAQTIIGQWETYDDKTKEKKAIVDIYKENDMYFGKIIKTFIGPKNALCLKCEGSKKDEPMIGLVIMEDIKKNGDEFDDGTILDPETGDVYKCNLKLINKNKLEVRGFIGISIIGRTQIWKRKT